MVIFDTVSMLFWGVFLTKDVRHETKEIVYCPLSFVLCLMSFV